MAPESTARRDSSDLKAANGSAALSSPHSLDGAAGDGPSRTVKTPRVSSRLAGSNVPFGSVNERILNECHELYTNGENALCRIGQRINVQMLPPRRRITVLLIGNHSAGKSSYINWYVEEHVQRTGVAIETQGFTFVTSGKKRESLRGPATLDVFKRFRGLENVDGVVDYLSTEVTTSKQKHFALVTFIDTPGLVDGGADGGMGYHFDVNKAILWLGNQADLIFVFFDPIGQALCKRTMTLVEKLNDKHADKMRFYLSKADEAGDETDRQRVMMQIVQELCKRPGLNRAGFDMPTIYIPNPAKVSRCTNQIDSSCKDIEKTINHTVQHTLDCLAADAKKLSDSITTLLTKDRETGQSNWKNRINRHVGGALLCAVSVVFVLNLCALFPVVNGLLTAPLGQSAKGILQKNVDAVSTVWSVVPEDWRILSLLILTLISIAGILYTFSFAPIQPRLSSKKRQHFEATVKHLQQVVLPKQETLRQQYLHEIVGGDAA